MSGQQSFTVASQADLNNAIATIEEEGNGPAAYTITFTGDITEGQAGQPAGIDAISLATGASLTINGAGYTLDGTGTDGGLAVLSGKVTIESLTLEDTLAQGGAGEGSGGGGAGLGGGLFVGSTAQVTARSLTFRTDTAKGGDGGTGGGGGVGGNASPIVLPIGIAGAQGKSGTDDYNADGAAGGDGSNGGNGGFGQPGGDGGSGGRGGQGTYMNHADGGTGGSGGKGADGGSGGVGGHGGNGGDGGDAGAGGMGGHGTFTVTTGGPHTTQSKGGPGFDGGDDGTPGDGGKGGSGGLLGGGGAGGDGGYVQVLEEEVVIAGYGGGPGGEGGSGARTEVPFMGTRGGHGTAQGPGQKGGDGGDGSTGGNGGAGGSGGFGGGGGGGGDGADGSDGGRGGTGGHGAESFYGLDGYANGPLPTPSKASDGGTGGNGGNGGNGGDGAAGGFGGFGGGGGGGGLAGSGGEAGSGGQGGAGGLAFTGAIDQGRSFPSLNGASGPAGMEGEAGDDGKGGAGQPGGFGAGGGANGSQGGAGGGGLGAGGDIFVAQGGTLLLDGGLLTGGAVAGGTGAADGSGFGSGIFLQGNETIALAATAARTLTVNDQIADVLGSGGTQGAGRLDITGTGTVALAAKNSFVGGIEIEGGTLKLGHTGAAGAGPISFAPAVDPTLTFSANDAPTNPIDDFGPGDVIDITGFASLLDGYTGGKLTLNDGGQLVVLDIPDHQFADFTVLSNPTTDETTITSSVACYCAGTLILTERGERPVEQLAAGDVLVTAFGERRSIRWVGRRSYGERALAAAPAAQPVRFAAGSLGDGVPRRDLLVSQDHAMLLDGVLVPARELLNGGSVRLERMRCVAYFHVELDTHDVLLAEGAASESFLDDGSRRLFQNAAEAPSFHRAADGFCRPRVRGGERLQRIRRRLAGL